MSVLQSPPAVFHSVSEPAKRAAIEATTHARLAGVSLLVALGSIIAFQGGGAIVGQGPRPEDADSTAQVAAYFGHAGLALIFMIGIITVIALSSFAISIRHYLATFSPSPSVSHVVDLGVLTLVLVVGVYTVVIGLGLALIKLAEQADPGAMSLFAAFTWLYDGTLNWIEGTGFGLISLGALLTGAWPWWLTRFGLLVSALLLVLAAPSLVLG